MCISSPFDPECRPRSEVIRIDVPSGVYERCVCEAKRWIMWMCSMACDPIDGLALRNSIALCEFENQYPWLFEDRQTYYLFLALINHGPLIQELSELCYSDRVEAFIAAVATEMSKNRAGSWRVCKGHVKYMRIPAVAVAESMKKLRDEGLIPF